MRLDASGNLGVGTTSPVGRLNVAGADTSNAIGAAGASLNITNTDIAAFGRTVNLNFTVGNGNLTDRRLAGIAAIYTSFGTTTAGALAFATDNGSGSFAERMRLDSSGNFGIGTSSPGTRLHVTGSNGFFAQFLNSANSSGEGVVIGSGSGLGRISSNGASTALTLETNGTERARIDSSGNLLVGTTLYNDGFKGVLLSNNGRLYATSDGSPPASFNRLSNDGAIVAFNRSTVAVGSISVTTTSTAYNTSSDYRLKENIQPMTGALAKVAALKPVTYKWNVDNSNGEGFIAHELAEVCPDAVTGEKDAVDAEGNPQYQGIDTSFLVATLTAAIQELKAEFDAYKATHP